MFNIYIKAYSQMDFALYKQRFSFKECKFSNIKFSLLNMKKLGLSEYYYFVYKLIQSKERMITINCSVPFIGTHIISYINNEDIDEVIKKIREIERVTMSLNDNDALNYSIELLEFWKEEN